MVERKQYGTRVNLWRVQTSESLFSSESFMCKRSSVYPNHPFIHALVPSTCFPFHTLPPPTSTPRFSSKEISDRKSTSSVSVRRSSSLVWWRGNPLRRPSDLHYGLLQSLPVGFIATNYCISLLLLLLVKYPEKVLQLRDGEGVPLERNTQTLMTIK